MNHFQTPFMLSRRRLLQTGAAATALLPMAAGPARAASYVRASVTSQEAEKNLATYKAAIETMLKLDPQDPFNWYRQAMIHVMDCPHSNWWFLPWHRAYLWNFETIIRKVSGDNSFALPYWDWTKDPYIPKNMWDGVLSPTDSAYLADGDAFAEQFKPAINAFWGQLTGSQLHWLYVRGISGEDKLLAQVVAQFTRRQDARLLTPENPGFGELTLQAVSLETLTQYVLAPLQFEGSRNTVGFGSYRAAEHDQGPGYGPLESAPHNNVHNSVGGVGGMMAGFMSPVDPIFYMHHANVDRIWTVWEALQDQDKLPFYPDDQSWLNEQFVFFVNSDGKNAPTSAGAWTKTIDYSYTPGAGSDYKRPEKLMLSNLSTGATLARSVASGGAVSTESASVDLPDNASPVCIEVSVSYPSDPGNSAIMVFVNAPDLATNATPSNPGYVGSIAFFGGHAGHGGAIVTQQMILPKRLMSSGLVQVGGEMKIDLIPVEGKAPAQLMTHPMPDAAPMAAPTASKLLGVQVLL
jgi:tyrosinase